LIDSKQERLAFADTSGFGSNQIKIFEVLRKACETFMLSTVDF